MSGVFTKRILCEGKVAPIEGRDPGRRQSFIHWGERLVTGSSLWAPRRKQFCWYLDYGPLAPRSMRQYVSVLQAIHLWCLVPSALANWYSQALCGAILKEWVSTARPHEEEGHSFIQRIKPQFTVGGLTNIAVFRGAELNFSLVHTFPNVCCLITMWIPLATVVTSCLFPVVYFLHSCQTCILEIKIWRFLCFCSKISKWLHITF